MAHVTFSRQEITLAWLEMFQDWHEMPFSGTCKACGRALTAGDYRDTHFPHEDEYNICWKCDEAKMKLE